MYRKYGFAPQASKRTPIMAPNKSAVKPLTRAAVKKPTMKYRLGNCGDYINSPGFPGSSTMWLYGMGADFDFSTLIQSGTDLIKSAAETALPAYYQYQIAQANLERAKTGLPPISAADYAPQLYVGASPQTLQTAQIGIGTIALLGAGALAIWAITSRKR